MDAIGIGALNLDHIYRIEDTTILHKFGIELRPGREILRGEEDFARVKKDLDTIAKAEKSGGGSAANTIFALSMMGFSTGYVGKVGIDPEGDFLIEKLGNVDTSHVKREGRSGLCIVLLDRNGDRFIIVLPNSNDLLCEEDLDLSYLNKASYLHMSSFSGPLPFRAQIMAARSLSNSVRISLDPGDLYAKRGLGEMMPLIENCFIIFATQSEIEMMTGKDYINGSTMILDAGPEIVVCKRGALGSHTFTRSGNFELPAEKVEAVDTTGAGDVYNAGFIAGLLLHLPIEKCAILATKAACLSITGYGRDRYPDRSFLNSFLNEKGSR